MVWGLAVLAVPLSFFCRDYHKPHLRILSLTNLYTVIEMGYTPGSTNIAAWNMDPLNFEDVFPIENGDILLLC